MLLTCKDAAFGYDGRAVISGLDFAVHEGDYLCIVGENGAGKSTLMRGLLRLLKPVGGSIEIDASVNEIGYLPQQTDMQKDFPASVQEVVRSGLLNKRGFRPFYNKDEKQRADEAMGKLGILSLKNQCYQQLSGGQQQRVLLARAMCAAGRMLLLDEPLSGLDPNASREFYSLLRHINRETGMAIIMVSHDIRSAVDNAKHILHLNHTQLFYGTAAEYAKSMAGQQFTGSAAHA